jgi:hypothetical protein
MSYNSVPRKVKPVNHILPFPERDSSIEERLASIEAETAELKSLIGMISGLCEHLGLKREKEAPKVSAPAPTSEPRRLKRLRLLHMHMSTIPDLQGTFLPISGDPMYRIYFVEDRSWLWYSDDGRLYADIKDGNRKTCKAAVAIDTYRLKDAIP